MWRHVMAGVAFERDAPTDWVRRLRNVLSHPMSVTDSASWASSHWLADQARDGPRVWGGETFYPPKTRGPSRCFECRTI
jgi:hypothetical protein